MSSQQPSTSRLAPPKSNIIDNKPSGNVSFKNIPVNQNKPSSNIHLIPQSNRGNIKENITFRLSTTVEACISEYIKPIDQFDNTDFDPINFINTQFLDEASLTSLDYKNEKLKNIGEANTNIKKIDAVINTCGRQVHALSEDISRVYF